jgi:hypothetical protein
MIRIASSTLSARWIRSMSCGLITPSATIVSRSKLRTCVQKSPPIATSGKDRSLPVCINVMTSNASSRVPKPPGITTKAVEYLTNITLRTNKCSNSMKRSR